MKIKGNIESYQGATIGNDPTSIDDFEMLDSKDGDGRDGTEPMENDVSMLVENDVSMSVEIDCFFTATDSDPDCYRTPDGTESELSDDTAPQSDDCLDVARPAGRHTTELSFTDDSPDHGVSHSDHRLPSQYDLDALAAYKTVMGDSGYRCCLEVTNDNSFLNNPRNYPGVASEDEHKMALWGNGNPALSERSESPRRSEPPSRSSTASPTAQQRQLRYEAVNKFEHDQKAGEPYSHLRLHWVSADIAMLFPEHVAAAAAGAAAGPWSAQ